MQRKCGNCRFLQLLCATGLRRERRWIEAGRPALAAEAIERTRADLLLAGDLGCLMNMAGKLHRRGSNIRCYHTVEILAGGGDGPAVGEKP